MPSRCCPTRRGKKYTASRWPLTELISLAQISIKTAGESPTAFVIASVFLEMQAPEGSEFDGHRQSACG